MNEKKKISNTRRSGDDDRIMSEELVWWREGAECLFSKVKLVRKEAGGDL